MLSNELCVDLENLIIQYQISYIKSCTILDRLWSIYDESCIQNNKRQRLG